jgi:CRISPR-associated protein Cst1
LKRIKEETDYIQKASMLEVLIEAMKIYEDVFLLKDITYTKIQPFWTNVAFLNRNKNKSEFNTCFDEAFTTPAIRFTPKEGNKATHACCQCSTTMGKADCSPMSWINDVGVDMARKTSYYWNFNVDSFLCPICTLIYACIPLGFFIKGQEGIFINDNENIITLIQMNEVPAVKLSVQRDDLFYRVIDKFVQLNQEITAEKEINNIQIIRRSAGRYVFNILSKEKLKVITHCNNDFANIAGVSFKLNDDYINIYREAIQSILTGKSLYDLIHSVLHTGIDNGMKVWFVRYLVKIQAIAFGKGDEKMIDKAVYAAMKRGEDMRSVMLGDKQNENKVRTLSYKLLNALKTHNPADFMDVILRTYIGLGKQIPVSFLDVLNEDQFSDFGYAFITGLNGGIGKNQDSDKEVVK